MVIYIDLSVRPRSCIVVRVSAVLYWKSKLAGVGQLGFWNHLGSLLVSHSDGMYSRIGNNYLITLNVT